MRFLQRHWLLLVGLAPVLTLALMDLESRSTTWWMKLIWLFGFVCTIAYVSKRARETRDQLRGSRVSRRREGEDQDNS